MAIPGDSASAGLIYYKALEYLVDTALSPRENFIEGQLYAY